MLTRRAVIVGGLATLATTIPWVGARGAAAAGTGSLRLVHTSPETLVTPPGELFAYSEMRVPAAPALTPTRGSISIDGLVARPLVLNYGQLQGLPHEQHMLTLECYVNTAGGPLIFNTQFSGVPLARLMALVGVSPDATAVRIETIDRHTVFVLPMTELTRPGTMLVAGAGAKRSICNTGVRTRG